MKKPKDGLTGFQKKYVSTIKTNTHKKKYKKKKPMDRINSYSAVFKRGKIDNHGVIIENPYCPIKAYEIMDKLKKKYENKYKTLKRK